MNPRPIMEDPLEVLAAVVEETRALRSKTYSQERHIAALELKLKLLVRRNRGPIRWTNEELAAAVADERTLLAGATELDLADDGKEAGR